MYCSLCELNRSSMKIALEEILLTITLFIGLCSSAETFENITVLRNASEPRYIEYVDYETNTTRVIDLDGKPELSLLRRVGSKDPNAYLLYTRSNPSHAQVLFIDVMNTVYESYFNPSDQTVVIVHGWIGDRNSQINGAIKEAFLTTLHANVIVVDWSKVASANYVTATLGVPKVGRSLGRFLEFLNSEAGASYNTMHLVGFSLGAHVVGNAGKYLEGRVARITGLDPAGPLWSMNVNRLSSANAVYVEAIHTDRNLLGTSLRSGHVDFYPNGGNSQPGCLLVENSCSHHRSWQLFAATVVYDHLTGRRCDTDVAFDLNMCYGDRLHMGNDDLLKIGTNGKYKLRTTGEYPYPQVL